MKVKHSDNKIIVYLYNEFVDLDNTNEINKYIKNIFIRLMKRYNINFFGYSKVYVYHNSKYGIILEIEKMYDSETYDIIDLKVIIFRNVTMYLVFDDYYFNNENLIIHNNKYYLDVENIDNISKYIEFGEVIYYDNDKKL